tara:strand:+ start:2168 stop:3232 length:1065 start_codon:yes stop_codon:yes gene_type:complete
MLKLFIIAFFLSGCAKTVYIAEQAKGQISLQWNGRDNEEVLKDKNVPNEHKEKIKLVQTYREWFFKYWDRKPDSIYSKTTMLENEAVTWLVITAPWNEVKAIKECFPFTGCFPYLGFFNKKSAIEWKQKKEKENFQTWMRPVYAYSTLGHFEDRILSSFFHYDKYELAELVFHELFHVMYFLKDNVDFNENLANFFGEQMAKEYFENISDSGYLEWKARLEGSREIRKTVADGARELSQLYAQAKPSEKEQGQKILEQFLQSSFMPSITETCAKVDIPNCSAAKGEWNNARFAATMTYEKAAPDFERLYFQQGASLRRLLTYIRSQEAEFHQSKEKDFTDFLFSDRMVKNKTSR